MARYLCIHGHFYQPPRENPWLERVERELSAAPAHDWNTRILHECYHPNTCARIRDDEGLVRGIMNTYSRISFNFGPTLIHWMERHFPQTLSAIVRADQESAARFDGHGNAIAQAYNHLILPLASYRDKVTQVRWGIADFERVFGRAPEGMWLPETAVDRESLEVLVDHGIRFTILSPRQAHRCRPLAGGDWSEVNEHTLETRRPYLCRLSEGRSIAIFFYHGGLAGDVAFGGILREPQRLVERVQAALPRQAQGPWLAHLATDGESYGHHSRGGEEALAYVLDAVEKSPDVDLINYASYLAKYPPSWEVEIREKSSWSCAYGVERWRSGYGYTRPEWSFEWRKGLREGLDALKARFDDVFEREGARYFAEPWAARDAAIQYLSDRSLHQIEAFLQEHILPEEQGGLLTPALRLLEMQHQALLMFTSCGWFFDDISNIEAQIILRHAWNAIRMAGSFVDADELEALLLSHLAKAKSNFPQWEDGTRVWLEAVRPSQLSDERILTSALVRAIFVDKSPLEGRELDGYTWRLQCRESWQAEKATCRLFAGLVHASSRLTLEECQFAFCVLHLGGLDLHCWVVELLDEMTYPRLREAIQTDFRLMPLGRLYESLRERFGGPPLGMSSLVSGDVEAVTSALLGGWLHRYEHVLFESARGDTELLHHLHNFEGPLPSSVKLAIALIQYEEINASLSAPELEVALPHLKTTWQRLLLEEEQRQSLSESLLHEVLSRLESSRNLPLLIEELQSLFGLAEWLEVKLEMAPLQDALLERYKGHPWWREQEQGLLQQLGELLQLSPAWVAQLLRREVAVS
ncbi:MAG: DUF3536 domain-containing protein [Myxococcales bacterium]|nr:DUF3536 domain-containing protein [Myxococcales bacterium]